jgi:hypothetical protein
MLRFSLVRTNHIGLTRWQIHKADCPDVIKLMKEGAFTEILSAPSAERIVESELDIHAKDGWTEYDYEIMPCCLRETMER